MSPAFDDWTPEELLAELRARERMRVARAGTAAQGPGTRGVAPGPPVAGTPGVVARFRRLGDLSSRELVEMVNQRQRSIYGTDDRKDVYAVTNRRARPLIDAVVALVERADLSRTPEGAWALRTTPYGTAYQLCSSEPFVSQPLGCFGSGVLLAPDVVGTAGHCVKSAEELADIRFVFGFRMLDARSARLTFPDDDVYAGREVIERQVTATGTDWALVRLDRPVAGRHPVPFRRGGRIGDDEPVFVVGHPCGLPQKLAGGARVRNNAPEAYFAANLDAYGGNSGSPVFNAGSYELEGLLARGQTDFVSTGSCYVSLVYPTTGPAGEDVTRCTEWARLLDGASAT